MSGKANIRLSRRETQVAGNLALGKTRKEVANNLYISKDTAVTHAKNIYEKTGCNNLADITRHTIADALGKTIEEIDQAIRKHILDFTKPLKLILMTTFIAIQVYIIYVEIDDMARARTMRGKVAKVKKTSKKVKEDYYA